MSDSHLRDLERTFRASGRDEDEAVWLRARLRAGDLSEDRINLTAYLGHIPSRLALGQPGEALAEREYWTLFYDLLHFGEEANVRAALAVARLFYSTEGFSDARIDRALSLAEQWLVQPSAEVRQAAIEAGDEVEGLVYGYPPFEFAAWFASQPSAALQHDSEFWREPLPALNEGELLRLAVFGEVIPWALGYQDRVRERVEARNSTS